MGNRHQWRDAAGARDTVAMPPRCRETWRPVIDAKGKVLRGYEVSDLGRVRSYWTIGPKSTIGTKPRLRKPSLTKYRSGLRYHVLCLRTRRGRLWTYMVHELVAYAFLGKRPRKGHQLIHLNQRRCDNRAANLMWVSRSRASLHAIERRPRRPLAKLTPSAVRHIRESLSTARELAEWYEVDPKTIYKVKWRKSWRDVK